MLKLLVADDHPLFREALIGALQSVLTNVIYFESDSFTTTLDVLRRRRNISLVVLDLNMPGCDNFYGLLRIREHYPDLKIAVVSASDDIQTVSESMEFGANAFIPKTTSTLTMVSALETVLEGGTWVPESMKEALKRVGEEKIDIAQKVSKLTPKQFKVLRLLKQGLTNKDISQELNVTEATVKAHVSALFKRLDVKSRTQILVAVEKLSFG